MNHGGSRFSVPNINLSHTHDQVDPNRLSGLCKETKVSCVSDPDSTATSEIILYVLGSSWTHIQDYLGHFVLSG